MLGNAVAAIDDLRTSIDSVVDAAERMRAGIDVLGKVVVRGGRTSLAEIITFGSELAHHHTKLIGGVSWPDVLPSYPVVAARSVAISTVAAALSALAISLQEHRSLTRIEASVTMVDGVAHLRLACEVPGAVFRLHRG